jgi:tetratricopeptide (TPR) repeat protein
MPRFDRLEIGPSGDQRDDVRPAEACDDRSWLSQADAERRKGLYENALRYYSRALEVDKALVVGWVGQVQMLTLLGEYPEADLWSRKALEIFPGNGDLLASRAQAVCRLGDKKQAMALSDAALSAPAISAFRWSVRGELAVATRQNTDIHCFDKAVELDRDWLVPLEIAIVYLHYKFPSRAQIRARQAIQRAPDQFHAWYVCGTAELQMDLPAQADKSFQQCLQLCPGHNEAKQRRVEMAYKPWSIRRTLFRWLRFSR